MGNLFSITLNVLYAPCYFYWSKSNVSFDIFYYQGATKATFPIPDVHLDATGFATNYVDANIMLSLFNIAAFSCRMIFERDHKTDFGLATNEAEKKFDPAEKDNTYEKLSLKVGGSLINIGKASMRIKAGIFYQWDWEYNHNAEKWTNSGKWIFGVGMRNLH